MLCNECPDRSRCREACPELEQELKKQEGYQREKPCDPATLNFLAQKVGLRWPDLNHLPRVQWDEFAGYLGLLPKNHLQAFLLHFRENLSIPEVARATQTNRVTAYRRINRSLRIILENRNRARKPDSKQGLIG